MLYRSTTSYAYAFRGVPKLVQAMCFWVWVARDPFNAGISLRILVSIKKILGTRAGTTTEVSQILILRY